MTANPGNVIKIQDLVSLTNAAYQVSVSVKNITSGFAKPGVWPFCRLTFSDEDFEPLVGRPTNKELPDREITVSFANTPMAREISGSGEDSVLPEDVCPFSEPGQRCKRRQRKKVKSHILANSAVKNCIRQEALARAAVEKKCSQGTNNYRNIKWQKNARNT
jgi:hypothetical protein